MNAEVKTKSSLALSFTSAFRLHPSFFLTTLAGLPATIALAGASRVTTAPAPMIAPRPTTVRSSFQSASACKAPSLVVARGYLSFMKLTPWPMKTSSSMWTPSQMKVWLEILQLRPDAHALLNLNERAYLRAVADFAAVRVYEVVYLYVTP